MPKVIVTRRTHFNAAHRLHNPGWSDEENARVFGPCANSNYHGHNYNLDVSVIGEVAPATGYAMDIKTLKDLVEKHVLAKFDHRNLNLDVEEFRTLIPSAENIVVVCWKLLQPHITPPAKLHRLVLWETERNIVEYTGG
jgi:6-pyruvoyltetrahydropterin/6-carboxytetrahydropterin synthase